MPSHTQTNSNAQLSKRRTIQKNNQQWVQVAPTLANMELPHEISPPLLSEQTSYIQQSRNPPSVSISYKQRSGSRPRDATLKLNKDLELTQ